MILDKVNAYRTPGNFSIMVYFDPFGIWWEKYLGSGAEQEERGQTCLNLTQFNREQTHGHQRGGELGDESDR